MTTTHENDMRRLAEVEFAMALHLPTCDATRLPSVVFSQDVYDEYSQEMLDHGLSRTQDRVNGYSYSIDKEAPAGTIRIGCDGCGGAD